MKQVYVLQFNFGFMTKLVDLSKVSIKEPHLIVQCIPGVSDTVLILSDENYPFIRTHLLLECPFSSIKNGPYIRDDLTSVDITIHAGCTA